MVPSCGFAVIAKASLIIVRIDGLAIRTRDLPSKNGGHHRNEQGLDERPQPIGSLRRGIGIEENRKRRLGQLHSIIHHPARIVFFFCDLHEVFGTCLTKQIH